MLSAGRPRVRKDAGLHLRGRRVAPVVACGAIALEPRLLFDGAAAVVADAGMAAPGPGGDAASLPVAWAPPVPPPPAVEVDVGKGAFADCAALESAIATGHEAVAAADVTGVDAADVVHFAISVRNDGRGDAFDLRVSDSLPDGFRAADVGNLRILDASGATVDFTRGGVLRDPASGADIRDGAAFAAALFSAQGVEFVDPGGREGYLAGRNDPCRSSGFTIAYEARLPGGVVAGSSVHNEASVVQVADRECGANLVDPCAPISDRATVTIDSARLDTRLIATDQVHTTDSDVVVGEILTYATVITLPEGRSPDAVLTQRLDPGLSLVCVESIAYSDGVEASAAPQADGIVPFDADGGEANRFVIDFGDVRNGNRDNRVPDTITVVYRAVATNVWSNQEGTDLVAAAAWRSGDGRPGGGGHGDRGHGDRGHGDRGHGDRGHGGRQAPGRGHGERVDGPREAADHRRDDTPLVELHAEAPAATIVEPVLEVAVTPDGEAVRVGEATSFTVTIRNDGEVDAFDVTIDDIALPRGLRLAPDSWAPAGGDVAIDVLRAGGEATFTLSAVVTAEARAGEALGIDVTVRYTSLPDGATDCGCDGNEGGGVRDRSPFVEGSDTERTGADGARGLNDYVAVDDGSVVAVIPVAPPCPTEPPRCAPPPPVCAPPPDCAPPPPVCPPPPPADCAPAPPPPVSPPPAEPPPAEPPPAEPPVSPPPAEPPPISPPPAEPPPVSPPPAEPPPVSPPPVGPPTDGPPPVAGPPPATPPPATPPPVVPPPPVTPPAPSPALSGRPGLPTEDPWPRHGGLLLDAIPSPAVLAPLGMADPFAREPLRPEDIRLPGGEDAPAPAAVVETPVGKDDECVPAKPVAEKPRLAKRNVFAEGAPRAERPSFSEQVGAAKKRIAPPVVVKARPAPDC